MRKLQVLLLTVALASVCFAQGRGGHGRRTRFQRRAAGAEGSAAGWWTKFQRRRRWPRVQRRGWWTEFQRRRNESRV